MEDVKKRAHLANENESGDNAGTPVKKRGRPANPEKVKKPPSGRGRGRPAKNPKKAAGSDDDDAVANGGDISPGRGRPPKGKAKSHQIESTGKGRGRPKKVDKEDYADDDDENDDEDKKKGKSTAKLPKKAGRPKKDVNSDLDNASGEDLSDDEDSPTVGRPSTSAVQLNISRTGRGQGRPKKDAAKKVADATNGTPKKRGRPAAAKPVTSPPTSTKKPKPDEGAMPESDAEDSDGEEEAELLDSA